jgi:hypothetical protein
MNRADDSDITPRLVYRRTPNGVYSIVITEPKEISVLVGDRLFAALLKCFLGSDRLLSLEDLLAVSSKHHEQDSISYDRNLRLLVLLLAATLFELGEALQELNAARVVDKMKNPAVWNPLNDLGKSLRGNNLFRRLRHQLGHHLGDAQLYDDGLHKVLARDDRELVFERADGRLRHGGECVLAQHVVEAGLGIKPDTLKELIEFTQKSHKELPDHLVAVFAEVLKTAGVEVVMEK